MRLSSVILLAAIAAPSTNASSILHKTQTVTANSIEKVKQHLAIEQHEQNRRTTDAVLDFEDLGAAFICALLELGNLMADSVETEDPNTIEGSEPVCTSQCDDDQTNLTISCVEAEEICDDANEFCTKDNSASITVSLENLEEATAEAEAEVCSTYTKAPFPELVNEISCFTFVAIVDETAMSSETDVEEPDGIITECGFRVGDTICQCSICDSGNELNLYCPTLGFASEECQNIESALALTNLGDDDFDGFGSEGDTFEPDDNTPSVIRFVQAEKIDSSSAVGVTPSAVIFSFVILAFAALL